MHQMIKNETVYHKGMMDSEYIGADMVEEVVAFSYYSPYNFYDLILPCV